MQRFRLVVFIPLLLTGCVSFSSGNPPPPNKTTVVVPQQGTTTTCSPSPCQ